MSRQIYKYPLELTDRQVVRMSSNADVLAVQIQNGRPMMWAIVDASPEVARVFRIYGTGHKLADDANLGTYVGTFQDAPYVWHVFEVTT